MSSGDNSNILAARVARETFGVENVVARIYDPGRAEVYQRLGIPTVATVRWTSDQMLRRLLPKGATPDHQDPSGRVVVAEVQLDEGWVGERISRIEDDGGVRVAYLTRLGEGLLPVADTVYQDGDLVHVVSYEDDLDRVSGVLADRHRLPMTTERIRRAMKSRHDRRTGVSQEDRSDAGRHHGRRERRAARSPAS